MSGSPSISVVVMTWNRLEALRRCLDSLAGQTIPMDAFEVVVVDASDPPAEEVVSNASQRLTIRHLTGPNLGVASNRNLGVQAARGRAVAFLDDDCTAEPDWLNQITIELSLRPANMVGGQVRNAETASAVAVAGQTIHDVVHEFYNPDGRDPRFFPALNLAVERERYLALGGCDEDFGLLAGEDRDFVDRWRHAGGGLSWCPEARVSHEHRHDLKGFVRQYFNYGRGAWRYYRLRSRRGDGTPWEDANLHFELPRLLTPRLRTLDRTMRAKVLLLVCVWEIANAAGFAWQAGADAVRCLHPARPQGLAR